MGYTSIVLLHTIFVATIYFFLTNLNFVLEIKIILCLALTFSSTIIASKSLEERKELNSFHGKISIIILILTMIITPLFAKAMTLLKLTPGISQGVIIRKNGLDIFKERPGRKGTFTKIILAF